MRSPGRLGLRAALLAATLVTCTSDHATGPGRFGRGYLAIRPVLSSPVDLAAFGLTIDRLRVVAVRPVADTALDTTVAFSPDSASLHVSLSVALHAAVETFVLHLELRAGPVVLFSGANAVQVSSGPPDTSSAATISLGYVGPGSGLTGLSIGPRDSVITLRDSLQFRVAADSLGIPVSSFYVHWSTSDTVNAPINGAGLLRAPNARLSVFVRAVTPNAVRDSTRVTFMPVPAAVAAFAGSGQSGTVGTRLPVPLRAWVKAGDSLGVQGVPVRFQPLSGGSVKDSVVLTDSLGFAEDTATLDTIAGAQSFRASVGALTATFNATATAGAISAAHSVVSRSSATVASGTGVTLTLRGKDQFGNNLTTGGATVLFTATGGTSTGAIGPTTDQGDGTYTATFTGLIVGSATTIGATIDGTAVTTTLPTITVTAGAISPLSSVVSTSSGTVSSGATATLTLQAKDSAGNSLATGGATVVFSRTGGTSTGTIGATTDNNDGAYIAIFTADSAGTPTTIRATIGGVLVTSTTTITVVAGNTTAARSVITVSADTIPSGGTSTLTLQAKDGAGNNITTGGLTVVFNHSGGTSAGSIAPSPATDNTDGTYTATFTGQSAGTATTIGATIDGSPVTSTLPTITVITGGISAATSVVTSSDSVLPIGGVATLTLQAKDGSGNAITTGGATVVFTPSGGTSTGSVAPSPATDNNDGTYTATFTAVNAGTPTQIGATINSTPVTSAPLPTIRVFSSVHTVDITADSIWTAAASPHIVSGNIRIRNGATLTIQAGATVKFDAGAGLQIGDTALGQAGRLNIDGAVPGIVLTANTATPTRGFWRGIEVQRALAGPAWRRTLIEYGGGTRSPFGGVLSEACVLIVNRSGAALDLDSLRVRQCVHAAIHHFGGTAHVHGGTIDTVSGSGIHVDFDAQLELDSTTIRGSGQEGLFFASLTSRLLPSSGNRVLGSAGTGIHLNAFQLPGLLKQDSIVGNGASFGTNFIEVQGGRPDSTVAAFTIFAQPQPIGSNGYLIRQFGGLLDIGRVGGQAVTLDSNVVMRFEGQTGLRIGDSAGTRSGTIRSLGTNALNRPVLNGAAGTFPGAWVGLEIGRLSGPDTLRFIRIEYAGDSIPNYTRHRAGLYIRNPVAVPFVLDRAHITTSGSTGSLTNSAGIGIAGTGGTEIRNSLLFQNAGYGIAIQNKGFKLVNDTIQNHPIGIFAYMEGGAQITAADSISGNTFPGTQYAVSLTAAALRALQGNAVTTAASDTLLFTGGLLTADATLPNFSGYVWRATRTTTIDDDATFTIAAGDTIAFDSSAGIQVGGASPAALAADGSTGKILLTASGPLPQGWHGVDFHLMSGSGATTNNVFRHVDVDRAGYYDPCFGECSPIAFGALRFTDSIAPTDVDLSITDVIVRRSNSVALDFQRGGTGTVSVTGSQFYENKPDPMIQARFGQGSRLSITGSDLYHYRGQVIQSAYRGGAADSVNAMNNWWGDLAGPDSGFLYPGDSLGRATYVYSAVRTAPFTSSPFFPVGPASGVVTTRDSLLNSVNLGDSIGIYARVIDANGRGVVGQTVTWIPIPGGASSLAPASSPSDMGGRVNVGWKFTNTAGRLIAHATGGGGFTDYFIDVIPGLTTAVGWNVLDNPVSEGTATGPKAITFTSTNRRGVIVTHAYDSFNNPTQPFNICFTNVNVPGCQFPFPQFGFVDSTHTSGGINGDTIFFHANVNQPSPFVLRAFYNTALGQVQDSVLITMTAVPAGLKIDRDPYSFNGIQTTPDTALFTSICPSGQPNFYCQREFHAFVVDSGLTPVGNGNAMFAWSLVPPTGAPVTFTTRGVPANDSATVTTLSDGFVRFVVQDQSANNFGADTMPVLVNQLPGYIYVTPDTASVLVGGTTLFTATVTDFGGDTMPTVPIHWRSDNPFNPHLRIIDTATVHQAIVRLDSTPFGGEYVTAFTPRGPGDTAYGYAQVINPVRLPIPVGTQPWAIAANSQTHAVYAGHQGGQLYLVSGTTGAVTDSTTSGLTIAAVAVNSITNRVFTANDQGVEVLDGATLNPVTTVAVGTNQQGVTNRQGLTVDSVTNRIYVTVDAGGAGPNPVLRRIDGTDNTFTPANDVPLPDVGAGAVFNPVDGLVYVTIPDSNLVVAVDPVGKTIVRRVSVGSEPYVIALNPITNRLYVIDQIFTSNYPYNLYVIDPVAGAVTATLPTGYQSASLAVDAVNNRVYTGAKFYSYVTVFDGATNTYVNALSLTYLFDQLFGMAFDAGNGQVYTANYTTNAVTRLKY
jgi:DNA-binding beta-propeller fold protein YncE